MTSLESLSLYTIAPEVPFYVEDYVLPSAVSLTHLRRLSLGLDFVDPNQFHRLISELCSLEELGLNVRAMKKLNISSKSIRKLTLILETSYQELDFVALCLSSLDLLDVEHERPQRLPPFQGKIFNLRKAILTLDCVHEEDCGAVSELMNFVSNVEDLILHIKESEYEEKPFPILLEPGKEALQFSNMKHLEATMCFHKHNFEAIVSIFHQSPALESVKLVHELPEFSLGDRRQKKDWKSKLPRNADRNYRYAYFRNLHLEENRLEFMNAMRRVQLEEAPSEDSDDEMDT